MSTSQQEVVQALRTSLKEVERLRQENERLVSAAREPIAIVGMSCRFPGGIQTPEDLWQLVSDGADAVSEFPVDRGWDVEGLLRLGRTTEGFAQAGAFLYDASLFDAEFFEISPREALAMDPQQRLLLEVAWEVFERARISPASVRGTRTGVYAGLIYHDYEPCEGYLVTGGSGSVASGRIAYAMGLEGPAVTVDTACSSSLVALHLAGQALRDGECDLALAGGVTVMSSAKAFVEMSRQGALAPDGRCKAFSAAADGTGFSEGVGLVLVERLSDARHNGHEVLAVVRGSAVNQDGASSGLTAPNGPSQQRVIRQALVNARLSTSDIDVLEAHGTGTKLGDPIEAQALLATYGQDRPADQPLLLGSVKSNIGHSQAAAGVAGVIKMVQALRYGMVPATLHVAEPSPHVDWTAGNVELVTERRAWPGVGRPRRAAISSFGISGTNAHLILEQAPEPAPAEPPTELPAGTALPWVVSGRSQAALRAQASRLLGFVTTEHPDPVEVAHSLARTRASLEHRAVVIGTGRDDLARGFGMVAEGRAAANVITGTVRGNRAPVFVFPGQGGQWVGMGRELAATSKVFGDQLAECAAAVEPFLSWSVLDVFHGTAEETIDRLDVLQPVLWSVMVSLAAVWRSYGVRPAAVIGHSQGEVAAAYVAGALSLEDSARVVALRSQVLARLVGKGGMASAALSAADAAERMARWDGRLTLAGVNGPRSVVLAGDLAALEEWVAECKAEGIRTRIVPAACASHCAQVEQVRDEMMRLLPPLTPRAGEIPFYSTVTGEVLDTRVMGAEYWYDNARNQVRFGPTIGRMLEEGYRVFVEIGAHPLLTAGIQEILDESGHADGTVIAGLHREHAGHSRVLSLVAQAHVQGVDVNWTPAFPAHTRRIPLPTYAFQRERFWLQPAADAPEAVADAGFWEAVERGDAGELSFVLGAGEPDQWDAVLPALSAWRRRRQAESTMDGHCYDVTWAPLPPAGPVALSGRWLLVVDDDTPDDLADACAAAVTAHGGTVTRSRTDDVTCVLSLAGPAATLDLLHALRERPVRVWCVTRSAVSLGATDPLGSPEAAMVWGLGRVAALEHPKLWGGLIDLPDTLDQRAAARLAAVLSGTTGENEVAIRTSGAFARRLAHASPVTRPADWHPAGTVLVTDGTGPAGALAARWLAQQGVPGLVLLGNGDNAELRAELAELGTPVRVADCDVTDRAALARMIEEAGPIRGVVHTAGTPDLVPLAELTADQLAEHTARRVTGIRHLHDLLDGYELDLFVLFTSVAGVLGGAGQAGTAAGDAYLDALAQHRRGRGLPATAIAWGPLAGVSERIEETRRRGLTALEPDDARIALGACLDRGAATTMVADIDWTRLHPLLTANAPNPLTADLPDIERGPAEPGSELGQRLAALPTAERGALLLGTVLDQVGAVLGYASADAIERGRAFRELGLDSVTAVELRNRLSAATGLRLPATLVFDHPTPQALAAFLAAEALGVTDETIGETAAGAADEPIVIVAMGCRFPGNVTSPDELWDLVASGGDGMGEFPADRGWELDPLFDPDLDNSGTNYAACGGFVYDAGDFDAGFFGISPREALSMDPQQRLLLESAWEALERADIAPGSLRGSRTGVFVGGGYQGYGGGLDELPEEVEGYALTGGSTSVLSGRIAYTLGLEGPAVTVDTACSSSLVALHLAANALRQGECDLALAGGVTVMATPGAFVEFSRQRGLSVDGRCKPFAAAADGTGWSEGVGMVLVERLSDAWRQGHRILAVLRGSAINSDGASNGLTAPNGPSQQRVIRQALAGARLSTSDIDVLEAHGTGTKLGDPIEAQALLATYGRARPADRPALLGSIKSNIGHTQAAAGISGVIKTVLALRYGIVPATLHVDEPTPQVDWTAGAVELVTEPRPWPEVDRPRRAAVSSFGMSGTNAHLILEQAPEPAPAEPPAELPEGAVLPWVVSGRSQAALRGQAARLREFAATAPEGIGEIGRALVTARSVFEHRAVVFGASRDDLLAGLDGLATGEGGGWAVSGTIAPGGRTGLLFSGQGAQRPGMGQDLYQRFPVFARALDEVCAAAELEHPLRAVMFGELAGAAELLTQTRYAQPALFAFEVALFRLLTELGVATDAVAGHSVGEIGAVYVAGALSLDDAVRLVVARGRLMHALPAGGAMVAIQAAAEEIEVGDGTAIAAINGPDSVVISGPRDEVDAVARRMRERGRRISRLDVSHAFHSPLMEPMLAEYATVLDGIAWQEPHLLLVSTLTGELADPATLCRTGYWVRQARDTVRFAPAVQTLRDRGVGTFLEVGPDATLTPLVADDRAIALVRRDQPEHRTLLTALARAYTRGVPVDWTALLPERGGPVTLPTYAFQRERYWIQPAPRKTADPDGEFWDMVERGDLAALDPDGDPGSWQAVLPALSRWQATRRAGSAGDDWCYRIGWTPLALRPGARLGAWLMVAPPDAAETAAECVRALREHGAEVRRAETVTDAVAELSGVDGVLSLLKLTDTMTLVQALNGSTAKLWCATRSAVSVAATDPLAHPEQAPVWGLGRVAALEHPDRWGGLIDLPAVWDDRARAGLAAALTGSEDQVAIRASGVFGRRLRRFAPGGGEDPRLDGTVLVTGGTGGLGARVARWLAARGVPHLVLVSRRGVAAPDAVKLEADLTELGCRVTFAACDVADRDDLARVIDDVPIEWPLCGVVHTAAVLDDGVLDGLTPDRMATVLGPKAWGARHLHELTRDLDLSLFVLFSSFAGVAGGAGQGNYAAANAYLDALAEYRHQHGLPATSIGWGRWAGEGMAAGLDHGDRWARNGIPAMDPDAALQTLHRVLRDGAPAAVIADIGWEKFLPAFTTARPNPLLAGFAAATAKPAEENVALRLAGLPVAEQRQAVLDVVCRQVAQVLGLAGSAPVEVDRGFLEQGFTSLTAIELRNRLHALTGRQLPSTLIFDYPTPAALAAYLYRELGAEEPSLSAQLDQLEALLAQADRRELADAEVAARLRSMAAAYGRPVATPGGSVVLDLGTATQDEVFDLIDREFAEACPLSDGEEDSRVE